jgi:alanine racemase
MRSRNVTSTVDLDAVRANAERIRGTTRVALIAVIKADAYGLGATAVADCLASVADEFAYFSIHEAREVGRPGLVLGPPEGDPSQYRELGLRPCVFTREDAARFAAMPVTLSVDTGMQRFGAPRELAEEILARGNVVEMMTHAAQPEAAVKLRIFALDAPHRAAGRSMRLHAASSAMLPAPETWLDAVRPGVALYRGALRVTTKLVSTRETSGPVGYTGFRSPRVGIILVGYNAGLMPGPAMIDGRRQQILEVGMNSSYVSVDARDRAGVEVVLLGDGVTEAEVAMPNRVREHEVLCRYGPMGARQYSASVEMRIAHRER